jgi:galactonate dehydratase
MALQTRREHHPMKIVDIRMHVLSAARRTLTGLQFITDDGLDGAGVARMANHTDAVPGWLAGEEVG